LITRGKIAEDLDQITVRSVHCHAAFDVNPFDLSFAHSDDECAPGTTRTCDLWFVVNKEAIPSVKNQA